MEIGHTRTYLWTTYNCFTFLFISWVYRVGSLEWSILSTHRDGLVMSEDTSFLRGLSSVQFSSAAQLCPTLCDPMDCSTLALPVHRQLMEFTQTHVHWVGDAISSSIIPFSSHLKSFPASGSFPMSEFFTSSGQSIGASASVSVLPMTIQDWFPLGWTGWISLQSKGLSRVFPNTTVQKYPFCGTQLSL